MGKHVDIYYMFGIIYIARNTVNGKCYIGKTVKTLERRMYEHHTLTGTLTAFQYAIKKYGKPNFVWSILCCCYDGVELNNQEILLIKQYNTLCPNGYNMTKGGDGAAYGELNVSKRPEVREKLRLASTGRKPSDATKKKISESLCGIPLSEKRRKNISRGLMGHQGSKGSDNPSSKEFIITHPDGTVESIRGLREFCRTYKLDTKSMRRVARGEQDNHKGYKCKYV